jgi:hypothetical protein
MHQQDLNERWNFIESEAQIIQSRNPDWRRGQALFNILYLFYPKEANMVRATTYDCFHRNDRIDAFKQKVFELWENNE